MCIVPPMQPTAPTTGTAITGAGVWHPESRIDNAELCDAYNAWVRVENAAKADAIAAGTFTALRESTPDFIERASGIKQRYVLDKTGILDPTRLVPNIPDRKDDELSYQAEFAVHAARRALEQAGRDGKDVDMVVLGASNLQRLYPALSIEVLDALGGNGYAVDIALGCSSATMAITMCSEAVQLGKARCAIAVTPELTSGFINWRDRDSHFIFGDAAVAIVVEPVARARAGSFEILSTRQAAKWSNNIRNNGGYLNRCDPAHQFADDKLFYQQGRRVFKDVVPMAARFIGEHLAAAGVEPTQIARFWLHQANKNMNDLIAQRLIGREPTAQEAPLILEDLANTASAGSAIAFARYHDDLAAGSYGVMASFGAGYSLGSVLVRRQ
jgi:beta-ketodecanoyl-[acyl-carrier-protein] synthase